MFFTPAIGVAGAAAVSFVAASVIFNPLNIALYGAGGAFYGAVGAAALSSLGFNVCSVTTAAIVGGLAGASIAGPLLLAAGVANLLGNDLWQMALTLTMMFLASFVISTALFLGPTPAASVAVGKAVSNCVEMLISC